MRPMHATRNGMTINKKTKSDLLSSLVKLNLLQKDSSNGENKKKKVKDMS
jgi:hypothetical protein